jgi:hypothetical protein
MVMIIGNKHICSSGNACIREVPGSNIGQYSECPDRGFRPGKSQGSILCFEFHNFSVRFRYPNEILKICVTLHAGRYIFLIIR